MSLILASTSPIRRRLLANAAIAVECVPPATDEAALRRAMPPGSPAAAVAEMLAEAKARSVSAQFPAAHVIGADQILVLDDAILAKPGDPAAARRQLAMLRGRPHTLISALAVIRGDRRLAIITDRADLTMRSFTDSFLDRYLEAAGWRHSFRAVVISQRIGAVKPAVEMFRAAEKALAVDGSDILHVGDDWLADIVGAKRAGWRAAYLSGRQVDSPLPGSMPDDSVVADLVLDRLVDLEAALADSQRPGGAGIAR